MKLVIIGIIAIVGYTKALDPGDACNVAGTGAAGTCRNLIQCQSAIDDIRKHGRWPTKCGFLGRDQIVCCQNPPVTTTTRAPATSPNRISARSKWFPFGR